MVGEKRQPRGSILTSFLRNAQKIPSSIVILEGPTLVRAPGPTPMVGNMYKKILSGKRKIDFHDMLDSSHLLENTETLNEVC
jgi:hypothetical protein